MGEASYTLIDDNGVEFYLSEPDKRKRERPPTTTTTESEDDDGKSGRRATTIKDVLRTDPHYQKARRDLDGEVRNPELKNARLRCSCRRKKALFSALQGSFQENFYSLF